MTLSRLAQKTINDAIQSKGENKEEIRRRRNPTDEVEINTTARKVNTAAKPKRQRSTHNHEPKNIPNTTPRMTKNNQRIQQKRESATALLKT
jgi:hypothetical protein